MKKLLFPFFSIVIGFLVTIPTAEGATNQFVLCLKKSTGTITGRIKCLKGETRLSASALATISDKSGPQGPKGDVGSQGLMGDKGDPGTTGPEGPMGPAGFPGPMGPQGLKGDKGDPGTTGAVGPLGSQGPAGLQGSTGPQGVAGPQGPAGNTGPIGPGISWDLVTSDIQLEPNKGYLVDSPGNKVNLSLPESISVGDTIRITSGTAPQSWTLALSNNQFVYLNMPSKSWASVASSADGTKLIAGDGAGNVYTSSDSGETWIPRTTIGAWVSVASSADGTKLVVAGFGDWIFTSSDSGVTWVKRNAAGQGEWSSIALSSDGSMLVASRGCPADFGCQTGYLYFSTDSGATWTRVESSGNNIWRSVFASADGSKFFAASITYFQTPIAPLPTYLMFSTNNGANWTPYTSAGLHQWSQIIASSDATIVAALANGALYISQNSGTTWTVRASAPQGIFAIACSSDGSNILAAASGDLYTSSDYGVTWSKRTIFGDRTWTSLALSSDGTKRIASSNSQNGSLLLSTDADVTWVTANGQAFTNIAGQANSAVELQYVGGGKFTVLSQRGIINFQ